MWLKKAAANGGKRSRAALGNARYFGKLHGGLATTQPFAKSRKWYELAEDDANVLAGLGQCHMDGSGVPKDLDKATGFLRRSAEQGCPA